MDARVQTTGRVGAKNAERKRTKSDWGNHDWRNHDLRKDHRLSVPAFTAIAEGHAKESVSAGSAAMGRQSEATHDHVAHAMPAGLSNVIPAAARADSSTHSSFARHGTVTFSYDIDLIQSEQPRHN